jgi:hypothetical protein
MATLVASSHSDNTISDNTISNAGIKTFDIRVITTSRIASDNATHIFVIRANAVHVANPPKQKIAAMQPSMTAKIRGGKIHGNKIQSETQSNKATTSSSFRLDYADIQNCAAFIANCKALAAIWH